MDETNLQVQHLVNFLLSAQGIIGVILLILVLIVTLLSNRMQWILLTIMLYISPFGIYRWYEVTDVLMTPLQQLRSFSRPIYVGALLLMLLGLLRTRSRGFFSKCLVFFLIFQLFYSTRVVAGGFHTRGLVGGISFVLIFIVLGWGMSRWMATVRDAHAALKCIFWAGILFVVLSAMQWVVNPYVVVWAGRFLGTTGNAQHAAVMLALSFLVGAYFAARPGERTLRRVVSVVGSGILAVFLAWTGSRTGLLMVFVGMIVLFGRNPMRLVTFGVAAALVFTIAAIAIPDVYEILPRLFSTDDTRSAAYAMMWADFKASPIWGLDYGERSQSENSYLLVLARTGIIGFVIMLLAMAATVYSMYKMYLVKRFLGNDHMLANLVGAIIIAIAVGAFFEGYLLGIYTFPVTVIYIAATVMEFIRRYPERQALASPDYYEAYEAEANRPGQRVNVLPEYQWQ